MPGKSSEIGWEKSRPKFSHPLLAFSFTVFGTITLKKGSLRSYWKVDRTTESGKRGGGKEERYRGRDRDLSRLDRDVESKHHDRAPPCSANGAIETHVIIGVPFAA